MGWVVTARGVMAFPSTIMEAAFGGLHNNGVGAFGARPIVVESIIVDGKAITPLAVTTQPNNWEHRWVWSRPGVLWFSLIGIPWGIP